MPVNLNRLQQDEEVVDNMKQLAISELEPGHRPPRYVHPDISRWYPSPPKMTFPPIYIWDQVRSFNFTLRVFKKNSTCFFKSYDWLKTSFSELVLDLRLYNRSTDRLHVLGI